MVNPRANGRKIFLRRNIVGQPKKSQSKYRWMLYSASVCMHTLLHVVTSCCVLLGVVAQSLKIVKLLATPTMLGVVVSICTSP